MSLVDERGGGSGGTGMSCIGGGSGIGRLGSSGMDASGVRLTGCRGTGGDNWSR